MAYDLLFTDSFLKELNAAPKQVASKFLKDGSARLKQDPFTQAPPAIKKLSGWKELYRLQLLDHRAIYRVDRHSQTVTLLMLGARKSVYERFGHDPDLDKPAIRIVADPDLHTLLATAPSQADREDALRECIHAPRLFAPSADGEAHLPDILTEAFLTQLNVAPSFHEQLLRCRTEADLLNCQVPVGITETVLEGLWPRRIEQVLQDTVREFPPEEEVEQFFKGERSLESFLLALDDTQKPFTKRFQTPEPVGPWQVKGGPGSGKSTVALYCVKNLIDTHRSMLGLGPLRILFTTYTKSLQRASEHLLNALEGSFGHSGVEFVSIQSLARRYVPDTWKQRNSLGSSDPDCTMLVNEAIDQCLSSDPLFSFTLADKDFLIDEIEWVILGNQISDLRTYETWERTGRGKPLTVSDRTQLWKFYVELQKCLDRTNNALWQHNYAVAEPRPDYDFVVVDEAQDLPPSALRFCKGLVKNGRNLLMTADANQSIYGSGFSWKRVDPSLDFRGRTLVLRRNYRNTVEIADAIRPLISGDEDADKETLMDEPFRHGPLPQCRTVSPGQRGFLADWLTGCLLEERLGLDCAAVICPTNEVCTRVAASLPESLRAKAMPSNAVDLSYSGIKVLTAYAAKGLQFPVVVVAGLTEGLMPRRTPGGMNPDDHLKQQRRLFYVACSRAMKRLLVLGNATNPSSFLDGLNEAHWDLA